MSLSYFFTLLGKYLDESPFDFFALLWFMLCFIGYGIVADNLLKGSRGLSARMHLYRIQWLNTVLVRENRMVDVNIIGSLQQSVVFFASTSIIILAGLLAVLGSSNTTLGIVKQIPFVSIPSKMLWYLKILLLIYLFIYAFFKHTWALRQLNYALILIGAMPPAQQATEDFIPSCRRAAMICTMAAKETNLGIRAYYFSIAALSWFVNPWFFMLASGWMVLVLFRREFHSRIVHVLNMPGKFSSDAPALENRKH